MQQYISIYIYDEEGKMSKKTHQLLRKRMLQPKTHVLLYRLFSHKERQNRSDIAEATSHQLNTIIRVLFCISVGHIPMKKSAFLKLKKSKRRLLLSRLRFQLRKMLKKTLSEKRKFLSNFVSLYPILLGPLFPNSH